MSCTRYAAMKSLRRRLMAGDEPDWLRRHTRRSYIVQAVLSAPPWVNLKALYVLRDRARLRSRETGVPHVLDHHVPLNHSRVSGLTVPWNLFVTTYAANARKSNAWCQWQGDLFSGIPPEQFQLEV